MEIKQPLQLLGTYLTWPVGSEWIHGPVEFIIWKKINAALWLLETIASAPRSGKERSEENKTSAETAAGIAFHEVVNRQQRGGSPWPFASSQIRSSPRAFTGFDERAPSRCVNHEPLRRFFESHPLSRKKRNRRDGDGIRLRSESFLRARIHTPRERRHSERSPDSLRAVAISLQNHEFHGKQRDAFRFSENRARERLLLPPSITRIISNVKHCNLNMDKARRVRAVPRYTKKYMCSTRMYISSGLCVLLQLLTVRNRRCCRNRKFENSKSESAM